MGSLSVCNLEACAQGSRAEACARAARCDSGPHGGRVRARSSPFKSSPEKSLAPGPPRAPLRPHSPARCIVAGPTRRDAMRSERPVHHPAPPQIPPAPPVGCAPLARGACRARADPQDAAHGCGWRALAARWPEERRAWLLAAPPRRLQDALRAWLQVRVARDSLAPLRARHSAARSARLLRASHSAALARDAAAAESAVRRAPRAARSRRRPQAHSALGTPLRSAPRTPCAFGVAFSVLKRSPTKIRL